MSHKRTSYLAWTLYGIITASILMQLIAQLANPILNTTLLERLGTIAWSLLPLVFGFVAVLIVSRQSRNVIGWLLMLPAISAAIPVGTYISKFATAPVKPSLLLLLALWFANWGWLLFIGPIMFIPLLFPTGRPLSARWRWLIFLGIGMCAIFLFYATFQSELSPVGGALDGAWAVPNPIGFIKSDTFPILPWIGILGVLAVACAASLVVRYRHAASVERVQIRWLLYACTTFTFIYVTMLVVGALGITIQSVGDLLLPIIIFPIPFAIAVAILRYRVWDIDIIIRRTLVYVPLTAILAGIFAASIKITQTILVAFTGGKSEAATVLTTLIVVAAFDPIKARIQKTVDARFKEVSNPEQRWKAYGEQVRLFVQMSDEFASAKRLLEEAVEVFDAKGGAVYLQKSDEMKEIHSIGDWGKPPEITIPLEHLSSCVGQLVLGARRNGKPFDGRDHELLMQNANAVAAAISLHRGNPT